MAGNPESSLDKALKSLPLTFWWGGITVSVAVLIGVWTTAGTVYTMKATLDQVKSDLDEYKKDKVESQKDREGMRIELATVKAKCCYRAVLDPSDLPTQPASNLTIPTMTSRR